MTHRDFRDRVGADIARKVIKDCGLKPNSLRQIATLNREIPADRRVCLAKALDALAVSLAKTLNNIARELRAEDEP